MIRKISVTSAGVDSAAHGIRHAVVITVVISVLSIVACVAVWFAGRVRLKEPDLERYVEAGEPAL